VNKVDVNKVDVNKVDVNKVDVNKVKVNEVAPEVSTVNKVNKVNEAAPEVPYPMNYEVELHVAHNEIKEEMNKGKPEVMRKGSFAAKSEVRTSWEPGESIVAKFDEVRFDVNVEAEVEVFDMKEVKKLKDDNKVEMLDAKEAEILVNIDKVGMQSFMKEVWSSSGAIEKALLIVMFLMKERFVNSLCPLSVIELSDYG